jgi:hypothetical protein
VHGRQTTTLILSLEVGVNGHSEPALLSTAALQLPNTAAWPMPARGRLNRLAAKGTGRVLFAIVDDRIVAAIGFTLKFKPIVAYVLAGDAELPALGMRNLRAAKECLHYIAATRAPNRTLFSTLPRSASRQRRTSFNSQMRATPTMSDHPANYLFKPRRPDSS